MIAPLGQNAVCVRADDSEYERPIRTDADAKDKAGSTPLFGAVRAGHKPMVELLISKGADPNAQDNQGQTPLRFAEQRSDRAEIAEILRKHAAKQ